MNKNEADRLNLMISTFSFDFSRAIKNTHLFDNTSKDSIAMLIKSITLLQEQLEGLKKTTMCQIINYKED